MYSYKIFIGVISFIYFISLRIELKAQMVCDTIILHSNAENEYDATVHTLYPIDNFSQDENTLASAWTIGGTPVVLRYFLKLPLPSLPTGTIINSASLQFKYNPTTTISQGNSYYPGTPYNYLNDGGFYRVVQQWDPQTLTWNNQPQYTALNMVWVPNSTSQTQDLSVTITPLINDAYLYPNNSYGFVFKMITEDIYRCQVYASSNHANPALHPKLVICYTTPTANGINDITNAANVGMTCLPQGQIRIENPLHCMLNEISIYSMDGSLIEHIPIHQSKEQHTIQAWYSLQRGFYVVRLSTAEGTITKKMPVW